MFDSSSRSVLKENGYYENFLIQTILDVQELANGKVSDCHYTIPDDGSCMVNICFGEHMGAGHTVAFAKHLTPLILASGFKLLDQIWEWVLAENGHSPSGHFWSFKRKYDLFTNNTLIFPDYINSEPFLQDVIKGLFRFFWPRRNAIIHSSWGMISGDNLDFDFSFDDQTQPGNPTINIRETISFNDLVKFAEFSKQVFISLVDPTAQTQARIATIKNLSDKIFLFHQAPLFNVPKVRVFFVHRTTEQDRISLLKIRQILEESAQGCQYFFQLKITDLRNGRSWEVNSEDYSGMDEIETKRL